MIGTTIAQYHIVSRLGGGGMGDVYLATDAKLNRKVALKFLAEQALSDPDLRARFLREAQAAAALTHPNIVPIYDVSEHDGRPFFVMEYVEGQSLESLLSSGRLSWTRTHAIATQICEGLQAAHDGGIIHGDIKPSNILIDSSDRVRLVDFGLARALSESAGWSQFVTEGTLGYASPEQLQGETLTPACDLFSFGVVLYQAVTGRRPFTGRYEAAVIHAVVNVPPPPMAEAGDDVPPNVRPLIERLLKKRPGERYQSAGDVLAELGGGTGRPVSGLDRPVRSRPKSRYAVAALSIVAVAILASGLGWWSHGQYTESPPHPTLAVLPFENLGPPADEYFADGMTDAITMHLLRHGDLVVISRSSSMQYKRSEMSLPEIGTELGADCLLMGSVQKSVSGSTERVRISARLVRMSDGVSLWSHTYDPPLQEIFALQSDIATRVTRALQVTLGDHPDMAASQDPTDVLEAYDLYLRGNEYLNRGWEQETIRIAIAQFERALSLDSGFAAAWSMLSRGHASMYSENYDHSDDRLAQAYSAARRALALDPNLPEAHLALGYCHYAAMAFDAALAEFAIVQEMQPNNRYVYNAIAAAQRRQGRLDEAVQNFKRALTLDPRSHLRAFDLALTYGMMRDYRSADTYLQRAILLAPDWPLPHIFRAWLVILESGDTDRARAILDHTENPDMLRTSKYYWWLTRIVEPDLHDAIRKTAPGSDTIGYWLHCAQINRLLGEHDIERSYADSALHALEDRRAIFERHAGFHSQLGLSYMGLRQKDSALAHTGWAVEQLPTSEELFDALFLVANHAEALMVFGEFDQTVARLQELSALPGFVTAAYLRVDPLWQPLHDNPQFLHLLQTTP